MNNKKKIENIVICSLIFSLINFGGLSFIINKDLIDSIQNYIIIIECFLAISVLLFINFEYFKINKIKKIPIILTIITLLWFGITMFAGIGFKTSSIKGFVNIAELLILLNVLINLKFSDEQKELFIKTTLISFVISAILGIYQYFSGINLITYSNYMYPGILGRINSTFYIATLYDKFVVLILPIIMYSFMKNSNKILNSILLLLSGIAISLTFSRSGLIIYFSLLIIYFIYFILKKRGLPIVMIIVNIFVMIMIPGSTNAIHSCAEYIYDTVNFPIKYRFNITEINPYLDQMYSIFKEEKDDNLLNNNKNEILDNSDKNIKEDKEPIVDFVENDQSLLFRDIYKNIGKQLIKEYPIFGIGIGNYSYLFNNQNFANYLDNDEVLKSTDHYMYPHNGFIHITAEVGVIGTSLLLITLFSIVFSNFDKKKNLQLISLILILYGILISGYTESIFHSKQYTYVAFIILILFNLNTYSENKNNILKKLFEKTTKKTKKEYMELLEKKVKNDQLHFIVTANPEAFMIGEKNNDYLNMLLDNKTDIIADGIGLVKSSKFLNYNIPERIPGVDIAEKLLEYGNNYNKSLYLFGSKNEVINKMKKMIKDKYPNIKLLGAKDGYIKNKDAVFDEIAKKEPDIVLIALGMPLQEEIIYKHLNKFKKGIFVGVGGSFDVLSGSKKRAPKIFIKLNLEWLYRIACEPKRIKRFWNNNIKFLFKVYKEKANIKKEL